MITSFDRIKDIKHFSFNQFSNQFNIKAISSSISKKLSGIQKITKFVKEPKYKTPTQNPAPAFYAWQTLQIHFQ